MTKLCAICDTENPENANYCQNCGSKHFYHIKKASHRVKTPSGKKFSNRVKKLSDKKVPNRVKTSSSNVNTSWWSKQSRNNKTAIELIGFLCFGLIIIIAVFGMYAPQISSNTTSNTTTPTTTTTVSNPYNVFENQYVQFDYPKNLVVKDLSTSSDCAVYIFSGNPSQVSNMDPNYVGNISTVASSYMSTVQGPTNNVNLNGTPAIEDNDTVLNTYELFVPSKNILFEIYTNQSISTYNIIKNSLIIKNG